ncbi:MAG: serine/threonine-protein kinase [Mariniblastus sp.]|nr:serine/threonine-protein kinase [Mariniblastus sp.]
MSPFTPLYLLSVCVAPMGIIKKIKKAFTPSGSLSRLDVAARFTLDRHAYTGTMSKFHVAKEHDTGNVYGIKLLDKEKAKLFRDRFKGLNKPSEGEIGKSINDPLIARTYEFGFTTAGIEYILMEYINGPGLNVLVKQRNQAFIPFRLELIRQMALSLQAVHDAGFIHRDVCPRNYICAENLESLKLIDFGLTVPDQAPYRMPGNRTGTPQYMAPEIVRRRNTDQRVDLFAFGVTVYRVLTFEHPWGTTDTTGLAALAHDTRSFTDIRVHRPNLHPKLAEAVHQCLTVSATDRMDSCKRFLNRIREVKEEDKV